jgi:hypothetical protein
MIVNVFGRISPQDRAQYLAIVEQVVRILGTRQPATRGRANGSSP